MTKELDDLFANNRQWAANMVAREEGFFTKLLAQQEPQYLWDRLRRQPRAGQ